MPKKPPSAPQVVSTSKASPSISLCMIAKNEELMLERCLASVRSIVSEIIFVDTGSTDRTVEIAQSFGAKVFYETWKEDFAEARNISLGHATGDWILVLDADEVIASSDLAGLQDLTRDRRVCTEFLQRHYSNDYRLSNYTPVAGEFPELEAGHAGYFESNLVRLFPNREGLSYEGKVHELVEHSIRKLGKHVIQRTPIRIHHYGHTEAVRQRKNKAILYTPLGQKKVEENPQDWKGFFELGVEHNNNGRLQESEEALKVASRMNPRYDSCWVNLGYVQCELGKYEEAIASLKNALQVNPDSEEAYCNLGVVFLRTGAFPNAEKMLRQAIRCSPNYVNAYNNLSVALGQMGRLSEAAQVLYRMIDIFPQSPVPREKLRQLYRAMKLPNIADRIEDKPEI